MSASIRNVIYNTRERLVSVDPNRAQSFAASALVDLLRYEYETRSTDVEATETNVVTATNPLKAVIFGGLLARPEVGTVNLFVEPGAALVISPDAPFNSDDSVGKLIIDEGVQLAGQLTLTVGSGSTRIDIIECAPVAEVLETDNRDIYNPATQLFTPQTVDKVQRFRFQYRIRTGTPGGGFAGVGTVAGWLPLAVCVVSSAAATWDDVDLYDVRPLLSDYRKPANDIVASMPKIVKGWLSSKKDNQVAPTTQKLRGVLECELGGRIVGGELSSGFASPQYVDLVVDAARYVEPGFAPTSAAPVFGYILTPFGLPRWCRYAPSTAGFRRPLSFRGIFVMSAKAPLVLSTRSPSSAITLPTALGLGGSTAIGVAAAVTVAESATVMSDFACSRNEFTFSPTIIISPSAGNNTATPTFTLQDGVGANNVPLGATKLRVTISTIINAAAANEASLSAIVTLDGIPGWRYDHFQGAIRTPGSGTFSFGFTCDVPIDAQNLPVGAAAARTLNVQFFYAGATSWATQICKVMACNYGP